MFRVSSIVVEFAKESRPKRDVYEADRAPRARRPPGHRLIVSGISRDTSWQVCFSHLLHLIKRAFRGSLVSVTTGTFVFMRSTG